MAKFLHVRTLEEARAIFEKHWRPKVRAVNASLDKALGQVLAENVVSKIDVPPFDRAAVDGYAVRAADTFGAGEGSPVSLTHVGILPAGKWSRIRLRKGRCIEIATGAPMPKGANAVVMVEHTVVRGKTISIYRAVAPGENVIKRGSDIRRGTKILRVGEKLTPASVGLLAAAGIDRVKVYKPPRVAVISSGAELAKPGTKLKRGQIYDVNGPALCNVIKTCAAVPEYLGIVADRVPSVKRLIKKALSSCDVVIVSGGSSAGKGDVIPRAVDSLGGPGVIVHGLAMKPGKPTFLAVVGGKPIFGLPGYPVSALMMFDQLVAPYLRQMVGLPAAERKVVHARLSTKILSARGRKQLVPIKLVRKANELWAEPILKESGAITTLVEAEGYIEVPLEVEIVDEGEIVKVVLFGGGEFA
jgi:molybdenum cofactor synthesis domain-containing protein